MSQRDRRDSPDDVLRTCGVKAEAKESALDALSRHARYHSWRDETIQKWKRKLKEALMVVAEAAFDSLDGLNQWLVKFGLPEKNTAKKARSALRSIHINIFDLLQGRLDRRFPTLKKLRAYTRKNQLFYPLDEAKSEGLRDFLRHLR